MGSSSATKRRRLGGWAFVLFSIVACGVHDGADDWVEDPAGSIGKALAEEDAEADACDSSPDGSPCPVEDASDACRAITIVARKTLAEAASTVPFAPSLRFALPNEIALSDGSPHTKHRVTLAFERAGTPGEITCTYLNDPPTTTGVRRPATFQSCSDGTVAEAIVETVEITISVFDNGPITATATLEELAPCVGADSGAADAGDAAGLDAGTDADADAGADANDADTDAAAAADADAQADAEAPCTTESCDDDDACTTDQCTPNGCTHEPAVAGTACSDGDACTANDTCDGAGTCLPGADVTSSCPTSSACMAPACDPSSGCYEAPRLAGTPCSDGSVCTSGDACNGSGACVPGADITSSCPTSSACMAPACHPMTGCHEVPRSAGSPCSDGSACTDGDSCDGAGLCISGAPLTCAPLGQCWTAGCDPAVGCVQTPKASGSACTDSSECTVGDACDGAGTCAGGAPRTCSATNDCWAASCDPATGCAETPRPAGAPCNDGNACSVADVCSGTGVCQAGTPVPVDDGDPCTVDACDPVAGPTHTPIPNCGGPPVGDAARFETKASLMGKLMAGGAVVTGAAFSVTDAPLPFMPPNLPRTDVVAGTAADGSFRVRLTSFEESQPDRTPPKHVVLRIEKDGYLPLYREAWVHPGDAVDLGVVKLVARDTNVTNIGSAGGTATDSTGRVQVVVPAGALSTTVPIVITSISNRDEIPAVLPDNTSTTYAFELEPTGTTFAIPVTVRLQNWRNAPTSLQIAAGYFETVHGRWEHEAIATWNSTSQRFEFQTNHFSTWDVNPSRPPGPGPSDSDGPVANGPRGNSSPSPPPVSPPPPSPNNKPPPRSPPPQPDKCVGSSCMPGTGSLAQGFALPTYKVKNSDFGITLDYHSGPASSWKLGDALDGYGVANHSDFAVPIRGLFFQAACVPSQNGASGFFGAENAQPNTCSSSVCSLGRAAPIPLILTRSVAGSTHVDAITMGSSDREAGFDAHIALPLLSGSQATASGLYRMRATVTAATNDSCVANGAGFGISDPSAPRVQTSLPAGPLMTFDNHVLVSHRLTSPFGAGWSVREASRLYRAGDVAFLVRGDSSIETFRPRAHGRTFNDSDAAFLFGRDAVTGEILAVRDQNSIVRIHPTTGALTTVIPSVGLPGTAHALAVAYVGASRRFVVATALGLIEIDSSGALRQLATRSGGVGQAAVAARGDRVFYAEGFGSRLFTLSLSDPTRTMTPLSLLTGGDVRLFPHATLSGVRFGEPRSLAFASDGTLYLADRTRNVVYAIHPDVTGVITGQSRVVPVVGDGSANGLPPVGERYPGTAISLREPLNVTMSDDGYLSVVTSYGVLSYDPIATEAEWLFYNGDVGELRSRFGFLRFGVQALSSTSFVSQHDGNGRRIARYDVDRLSSQFDPTRTLRPSSSGEMELLDTTSGLVEKFDVAGRLIETRARTGEVISRITYVDATGDKIDKIIDAVGGETTFSYGGGKIQSITDARGRTTTLTVDGAGDLVSLAEPEETYTFVYAEHRMAEKRTARNDVTTYAYRADGTLESATTPESRVTTIDAAFSHGPQVNATTRKVEYRGTYVDDRGITHALVLNADASLKSDTYVIDGITRTEVASYPQTLFDYVGDDLLIDYPSERRNVFSLQEWRATNSVNSGLRSLFDAHGRPRRESRGGSSELRRYSYDANGWLSRELMMPARDAQKIERDPAGHITRILDVERGFGTPSGRETTWTYRPDGLVATQTDHTITRTFAYDDVGGTKNETGWSDTLGRSMTYTRDARGNVTSATDGTATTYADFDVRNRVIATRDALGNETTYGYSHAGCSCSVGDLVTSIHTPDLPANVDWEMTYDGDRRLKTVTDPHGFTESYEYETSGEMKKLTDKLERVSSWTHDGLGRVKSMLDALGRHHGSVYTVPTAPLGQYAGPSLMAGSADLTASTTTLTGTMRSGDYQIGHNAYQPDGLPPLISLYRDATFQLAYTEEHDTAPSPRLSRRVDRTGLPIDSTAGPPPTPIFEDVRTWDLRTSMPLPFQRVSQSIALARFDRNFWFDVSFQIAGNVLSTEPTIEETPTRDAAGRVTQWKRDFYPGNVPIPKPPSQHSSYVYRADGRIERITNPDGQHDFTYNSRGLVQTQTVLGEGTYAYGYDELGRNDYLEYPDGHVRRQMFDDVGRITSRCYEYTGGPTTRCYTATYDPVGNPLSMLDPEGEDVFEYDALDRLKKATRKDTFGVVIEVDEYDYNALGALKKNANVLLDHQRPRLDGAGLADAAVPATTAGQAIALDAAGRVTSLRGSTFNWARRAYPISVQEPSPAPLEKWAYDADLRRAMKVRGSTAEFYFYEGLDRVATFETVGGVFSLKESTLFDGIDHPLRITLPTTPSPTFHYYELDLAGNVTRLRASGGGDLGGYRYAAFGQTKEDTATLVQPLRWKARWHSTLNGAEVYDVRARQWAPEIGVFISLDEYGWHHPKATLWGWPGQNPLRWNDPMGRYPTAAGLAEAAAAMGADGAAAAGGWFAGGVIGGLLYCATFGCGPDDPSGGPTDSSGGPAPKPGRDPGDGIGSGGGPGGPYRTPGNLGGPQYPECAAQPGFTATERCCRRATGHRNDDCDPNDHGKQAFDECMSENGF